MTDHNKRRSLAFKERILEVLRAFNYFVRTFHNLIMAVVVRILFISTGFLMVVMAMGEVWQSASMEGFEFNMGSQIAVLLIPHVLIVFENIYVLVRKCGRDYHWVCVPVFLYLWSTVPSIVIMQNVDTSALETQNKTVLAMVNGTESQLTVKIDVFWTNNKNHSAEATMRPGDSTDHLIDIQIPELLPLSSVQLHSDDILKLYEGVEDKKASIIKYLSRGVYSYIQMLLVVLLFGRWLLPRGKITREQLSGLLISYLNMCADMLDFISTLGEEAVIANEHCKRAIQTIWIISLLQFTIVKSNVGGPSQRRNWVEDMNAQGNLVDVRPSDEEEAFMRKVLMNKFTGTFLWDVVLTMLLQDLPFLVMRLIVIVHFNVHNATIFFFLAKNIVLVMMDIYRCVVICLTPTENEEELLQNLVPVLSRDVTACQQKKDVEANEDVCNSNSEILMAEPNLSPAESLISM